MLRVHLQYLTAHIRPKIVVTGESSLFISFPPCLCLHQVKTRVDKHYGFQNTDKDEVILSQTGCKSACNEMQCMRDVQFLKNGATGLLGLLKVNLVR